LTGKARFDLAARSDLSRWLRSGGCGCLQAKGRRRVELQEAAALSGGGGLAGHLVGDAKRRYGALINRVKTPKQRGRTGGFTEPLEGEEEAPVVQIGGEVRPADSCSGGAPVEHACWRGKEGEVVRRDWGWCPSFYTRRRAGETAQRRWAAVMLAAAIKPRWRPWCAAITGGRGRGRGWAAPGECATH
jgi:hypothetical protein